MLDLPEGDELTKKAINDADKSLARVHHPLQPGACVCRWLPGAVARAGAMTLRLWLWMIPAEASKVASVYLGTRAIPWVVLAKPHLCYAGAARGQWRSLLRRYVRS